MKIFFNIGDDDGKRIVGGGEGDDRNAGEMTVILKEKIVVVVEDEVMMVVKEEVMVVTR